MDFDILTSMKYHKKFLGISLMYVLTTVKLGQTNIIIEEVRQLFTAIKLPIKTTIVPIGDIVGITKHGEADIINVALGVLLILLAPAMSNIGWIMFVIGVALMFIPTKLDYHIDFSNGHCAKIQANKNSLDTEINELYKTIHDAQIHADH